MSKGTGLLPEKKTEETEADDYLPKLYASARSLTDAELLVKVKEDFPQTFWDRFYVLAARLEAETMMREEQKEFMTYTDRTEAYTVERLVHLMELGGRWGVSALDLIKQLGLRTGSME